MTKTSLFFIRWFSCIIIITLVCGLTYTLVQQDIRIGANDPQIQIAEDTATALANGGNAQTLVQSVISSTASVPVDPSKSLSPFAIVYDDAGNVVVSTGILNGANLVLPRGVLTYTKIYNEDRITWEPQAGVRLATVIVHYSGPVQSGYVLVARSMREVEKRSGDAMKMTLIVWTLCMIVVVLVLFSPAFLRRRDAQ